MLYIYSIILAVVQGLTEFLPISSSGHLTVLQQFIHNPFFSSLTFDVMLHLGTLLAVLIYFWADVVKIIKGLFISIGRRKISSDFNQQLPWLIIVGTIPAGIIGVIYGDKIEEALGSVLAIAIALIIGGILFIIFEKISSKIRNFDSLTFIDTIIIGLAQLLAFIPGISRSGATITAGLAIGLKREAAAKYSFLLSLPIIAGAGLQKAVHLRAADLGGGYGGAAMVGILVSAIVGYFAIKYFIQYLGKHSLTVFAVYRFIIGALLLIWLFY